MEAIFQSIKNFLNQNNDDEDISFMAYERPADKIVNDRINIIMEKAKHEQCN